MSTATPVVSVRESLGLLIQNEGWRAETFASAQEFLDHPRAAPPSCLILDVSLPGLDGLLSRLAGENGSQASRCTSARLWHYPRRLILGENFLRVIREVTGK
jgi:DNA-binding NarL/FixJ family response regulator